MGKVRLIIADDHSILLHGLCQSLEMEKNLDVVAKADSGIMAIDLASQHLPDLIIMDVSMPGLNGMAATKQILAIHPQIKIIALSMHTERIYVHGMMNAGVSGYMLKSCSFKELLTCINSVMSGNRFYCPEVKHLINNETFAPDIDGKISAFSMLSKREKEVLKLIAEGYTSKAIAKKLFISVKTIDIHRKNIKTKLDIHSIAELTRLAIAEGLTPS